MKIVIKIIMKNKKLFYGILIVVILVVAGIGLFLEIIPGEEREYYGFSTFGQCENDNDCFISGCNAEICQSRAEEQIVSICILPDKPTPQQIGYRCNCYNKKCQWAR
jgi:eight-cysteine-cluster-containing protein